MFILETGMSSLFSNTFYLSKYTNFLADVLFRSTPLQVICAYYTVNYLPNFHATWMVRYPAKTFF